MKPSVQASYMKNVFAALGKRGHLTALERRAPQLVRAVSEAPRMSWLPIEYNVCLVESVVDLFGEERGLALLADCVFAQLESPLWKGFVQSAVRLLGRSPGSLGRWLPQAFSLVFRDCGRWSVERVGEDALCLSVAALPPPLAHHRLWLRSLAVGVTPLFTLCGQDGSAVLEQTDERGALARIRLRWKPRG